MARFGFVVLRSPEISGYPEKSHDFDNPPCPHVSDVRLVSRRVGNGSSLAP